MRAAVPGKGGRRGNRQAGAGGGAPDPPGPAFCSPFWGRAIPCAPLDEEAAAWVRAGVGRASRKFPGRRAPPTVCGGHSEPRGCLSPGFSAGGFPLRGAVTGVKSPVLRAGWRIKAGARGARSRASSPAFPSTRPGPRLGN